jgi:AraC family transcriptional regulator of adaptative response/methylated-DNA-[protein]-cysteine methyltransferase
MTITYGTARSKLGRILVATSSKGICAISMGDSDAELERSLKRKFPKAALVRDNKALSGSIRKVEASVSGVRKATTATLDLQGTEFQKRVWAELRRIPFGSTRSYADVAKRIGKPAAFRAVANACGANPIPILVPCHRVVASGGKIGGFGGGLHRKRLLLEKEGVTAKGTK